MIRIGTYTFASEAARAADYRSRVGPMQPTRNIERPQPDQSCASWLTYLRTRYLDAFQIAPGMHQYRKNP